MSPTGAIGVNEYSASGLPTGLSINASTGVISGTPTAAATATASVTVTVSDSGGNTDTVDITFPAVAKGDQTLSGFSLQRLVGDVWFGRADVDRAERRAGGAELHGVSLRWHARWRPPPVH